MCGQTTDPSEPWIDIPRQKRLRRRSSQSKRGASRDSRRTANNFWRLRRLTCDRDSISVIFSYIASGGEAIYSASQFPRLDEIDNSWQSFSSFPVISRLKVPYALERARWRGF